MLHVQTGRDVLKMMNVMSPNNMHALYHSSLDIVKGGFGHKDRILNAFFLIEKINEIEQLLV